MKLMYLNLTPATAAVDAKDRLHPARCAGSHCRTGATRQTYGIGQLSRRLSPRQWEIHPDVCLNLNCGICDFRWPQVNAPRPCGCGIREQAG